MFWFGGDSLLGMIAFYGPVFAVAGLALRLVKAAPVLRWSLSVIITLGVFTYYTIREYGPKVSEPPVGLSMLQCELFPVMRVHFPAMYDSLMRQVSQLETQGYGRQEIESWVQRWLPDRIVTVSCFTSDSAIVHYWRYENEVWRQVAQERPYELYYELMEGASGLYAEYTAGRQADLECNRLALVFRDAGINPQPVPEGSDVGPVMDSIHAALAADYGEDYYLLFDRVSDTARQALVCHMWLDLYDRIFELETERAGRILRWYLAEKVRWVTGSAPSLSTVAPAQSSSQE